MEPETKVLRSIVEGDGYEFQAWQLGRTLPHWDIVAGNRYSMDDGGIRLIPDPDGPWLALVTHRGEFAPPRPKTLPVGAKVRRGPDWCWGEQDGGQGALGVVDAKIGLSGSWVRWASGERWNYSDHNLELVSLPAPASVPPIVERERARLEAAKAAPDDGTAARVIAAGLRSGKTEGVMRKFGEAMRDMYSGIASDMGNVTDAASYWRKAILSQRARPSAEEYEWCVQPQHPRLVGFYGISAHEAGQRPATGDLPDIIPAAVLARRASQPRRVFVPTDLDDHWIPDAEPEGGIVVRKAVS